MLRILSIAFLAVFAAGSHAHAMDESLSRHLGSRPFQVLNLDDRVQVGSVTLTDVEPERLGQAVEAVPADKDLIVSADSETLLADAARIRSAKEGSGVTRLIPFGKRFGEKMSGVAHHLGEAARTDKIGLLIAVINTGYDSYVWMHAYQFSEGVRVAQTIFTTLLAITFSIDKDLWANASRRIQGRIVRVFDPAIMSVSEISRTGMGLVTGFAANFALSLSVQAVRLAILSYDKMIDFSTVMSSASGMLLLSFALTFSNFGWSEFAADVDPDRTPFSKWVVRRLSEVRSFLMGQLAPSGKLLQPDVYGAAPWVALAINGAVGLGAYFGTERLIKWSETSPRLGILRRSIRDLNDVLDSSPDAEGPHVFLCEAVFSN